MLVKSCKSMGKLWFNSNTTGVARGVGKTYPSEAIECIPVFSGFILFNLKSSMSICILTTKLSISSIVCPFSNSGF
jgi:hypothetical protein